MTDLADKRRFKCFCALKYESSLATSLHHQAASIFEKFGFELTKGARRVDPGETTLEKIKKEIDRAFAVIMQTTEMSWWIAFEVFSSVDRKQIIPLIPEDFKDNVASENFILMFPNIEKVYYKTYGQMHFDKQLSDAIGRLLEGASRWTKSVCEASLATYAPTRPYPVVDPWLEEADALAGPSEVDINNASGLTPKMVFARWRSGGDRPLRAAIVAEPGAGKTLLLAEFARQAGRRASGIPTHTAELDPLMIFIRATELPERADLLTFVRDRVHEWETSTNQRGLFEPFLDAGLVYVLVDGIDEFMVPRGEEGRKLEDQLVALGDKRVNVIVSCRENFWFQQIQSRDHFEAIRIRRFDQTQALLLLRDVNIPLCALDRGRVKEWLLNPMFLRFILDISKGTGPVNFGDSRSELYENWARKTLGVSATSGENIDSALGFYGDVALALLKGRKKTLPASDVFHLMVQRFGEHRPNMVQILNNEVLRENKDTRETSFAHESIYEFFVARSLRGDFLNASDSSTAPASLSQLGLSQVELDYPQSAVYGFLQEFLDKDCRERFEGGRFDDCVRRSIRRLSSVTQEWRLIRNLIEYLGMIHCSEEKDEETAQELIGVAQDEELKSRVRYNALRALERIHPGAPRPYFRHVSDWGRLDYSELKKIAARNETDAIPYVMRGHGKQEPELGKHWAWVPNNGVNPDPDLHTRVSNQLGLLLRNLVSFRFDEGIAINASHAWIRWFDRKDAILLQELLSEVERMGSKYVLHNLTLIEFGSKAAAM